MSDEEEQYDPQAHKSLLQAVSNLTKVQHIGKTTRNEPKPQQDEFFLVKPAITSTTAKDLQVPVQQNAVGVYDIVKILKTAKNHVTTGKQLKNVHSSKKVLPKPLEKPAATRIKRTIGYENVKNKLSRWDAVVAKNRSAEQQIFPLPAETVYIDTSAYSKPLECGVKSKLRLEMEAVEERHRQLRRERNGDVTDEQEAARREQELLKKKLTRDELNARRRELAYLKMRESQKSAKARLQNKIKSKKYHKLLKRQKMKEQIKEFELLQKSNPEAALEKLNELEKQRALERASLRHKNTGAWAKNLQVRAKYDKDVRKDLAEQLQVSRQLTEKKLEHESSDEEMDTATATATANVPMNAADNGDYDPFNPWTKVNSTNAATDDKQANDTNWRKYWTSRNENEKMLAAHKQSLKQETQPDAAAGTTVSAKRIKAEPGIEQAKTKTAPAELSKAKAKSTKSRKAKRTKQGGASGKVYMEDGWLVEELSAEQKAITTKDLDDLFDEQEDKQRNKLQKTLNKIVKKSKKLKELESKRKAKLTKAQSEKKEKNALQNLEDLSFKKTSMRPEIDEELDYDGDAPDRPKQNDTTEVADAVKVVRGAVSAGASVNAGTNGAAGTTADVIDPTKVATVRLKQNLVSYDMLNDDMGEDGAMDDELLDAQKQMTISQAFEDDDIVADFSKDKAKETEVKNAEIDLSMPGWGTWAGAGISMEASKPKNKRLVLKLASEEKRRDQHKERVYINEEPSKHLRTHLVSDVPFPFTSLEDYENSIRAPIGRNFVPETAFRMLTRPAVITRKGQIIEPMDESELIKPERKLRNPVDRRIAEAAKQKAKKPL